jgi:DNA-directed RNA polymerase specialized sigma24 family protein
LSELYYIENYKDLLAQIDIHENILDNARTEQKYYQKQLTATWPHDISAMNMDGMPHGNFSPLSLDKIVENLQRCQSMIDIEEDILQRLRQTKQDIDSKINSLQGLYFKVANMRYIRGMTLQEIASELDYSLDRIKQVSAELTKNA